MMVLKVLFVLVLSAAVVVGQQRVIPRDAAIFIAEMPNDLDGFIRAELIQKKVPVKIVLSEEQAQFVLQGMSTEREKRKWHEGWLTAEQDHTSGNVMMVERESQELVWAAEAGDRSLMWGAMARGGQRKVASRIVKKLKDAVMKK